MKDATKLAKTTIWLTNVMQRLQEDELIIDVWRENKYLLSNGQGALYLLDLNWNANELSGEFVDDNQLAKLLLKHVKDGNGFDFTVFDSRSNKESQIRLEAYKRDVSWMMEDNNDTTH